MKPTGYLAVAITLYQHYDFNSYFFVLALLLLKTKLPACPGRLAGGLCLRHQQCWPPKRKTLTLSVLRSNVDYQRDLAGALVPYILARAQVLSATDGVTWPARNSRNSQITLKLLACGCRCSNQHSGLPTWPGRRAGSCVLIWTPTCVWTHVQLLIASMTWPAC